ncbi:hypothetical protein C1Y63_08535 [Corynebacterium sp. 13CS0277]|uniref:putative nucleotidyltransferase substrate binding domain-containing protein n=1 Tax=Corynebacterium sp. 13CS0277 TaxID=2071994 RepID=UPI000D039423|nr:putative nucleotidyltransferase substrate binding domain-containing protein [Corynebacterium sp. 13CS0277]PRQ11031.1 hypothetical protein C1Y63_08535 [Corynebacterium sp. 13CS0277]
MLHESLYQLAAEAPTCSSLPMARGVLADAYDVLRQSARHAGDATELGAWLSRIVVDVINSPAVIASVGCGTQFYPSGAFGRLEGLVDSRVRLLTWGTAAAQDFAAELLTSAGLTVRTPLPAATAAGWQDIAREAVASRDAETLGLINDAGTWGNFAIHAAAEKTCGVADVATILRDDALAHRPPAVVVKSGLPDKESWFDIREHLVVPAARLARWAGFAAGARSTHTPTRLAVAAAAGVVEPAEADALRQAWVAGMDTYLFLWANGMPVKQQLFADLPPIQRTLLGASARAVADVARSVAARSAPPGAAPTAQTTYHSSVTPPVASALHSGPTTQQAAADARAEGEH